VRTLARRLFPLQETEFGRIGHSTRGRCHVDAHLKSIRQDSPPHLLAACHKNNPSFDKKPWIVGGHGSGSLALLLRIRSFSSAQSISGAPRPDAPAAGLDGPRWIWSIGRCLNAGLDQPTRLISLACDIECIDVVAHGKGDRQSIWRDELPTAVVATRTLA
jgi:hypothetical protein